MSHDIHTFSNFTTIEGNDNLFSLFSTSAHHFGSKNCLVSVKNLESHSFTYEEVHHQVQRLCDSIALPRHCFVGILSYEISAEIIICILGILKSDAAFVFLNVAEPEIALFSARMLRIRYLMGEKSVAREFLTRHWNMPFNLEKTFYIFGEEFIWYRTGDGILVESEAKFAFAALSSGSTKRIPKVIKVPHRSILPNILDLKNIYKLEAADTIFVATPLTFDPCIHDIFLAFSSGCCILITDAVTKHRQNFICKLFNPEEYNVTVFFTTPSMLSKWQILTGPNSLRILILGGEPFPSMEQLRGALSQKIQIYNIYGITEVSCWASVFRVPPNFEGPVPLGSPLSDTIFQLRDDDGRVINIGTGELFIGSASRICVIGDESEFTEETRPCFRASGDLVKMFDEAYYFIGRKDRRIKLLGHQVDFTQIENIIRFRPPVKNCSVFMDGDEIVALVELNTIAGEDLTAEALGEFIASHLPLHMLPNDIRFVTELPLGSHGKISLTQCRTLYEGMKETKDVCLQFQRLWTKYTNRSVLDPECGFLDSGGTSFMAVQFNAALERITKVPRNFIEYLLLNKTVAECQQLVIGNENDITPLSIANTCDKKSDESDVLALNLEAAEFGKELTNVLYKGHCLCFGTTLSSVKTIEIQWRCNIEKCVDASPVLLVFNDRAVAVCGSHSGYLVSVEVATGNIISKMKLPDRIESSACASEDGRRIFIGCYDGNMYAIDIISSSIIWKYQTDDIIKSTAVLFNNKLFFGSYDRNFYCISSIDGALVWKVNVDNSAIYASAIVRSDIIILATLAGTVAFIDHCGIIEKKVTDLKPIFSNPTEIPGQNMFVVIDVDGSMRCYDLLSYSELWNDSVPGCIFSSLSFMKNGTSKIVFASQNGNIYCFEIAGTIKRKLWEHTVGEQAYATPFCCKTWNAVIAVSTDGDMHILEADSGHVLTSFAIKAPVFSSPIAFADYIVVGSRDNFLYCLKIS